MNQKFIMLLSIILIIIAIFGINITLKSNRQIANANNQAKEVKKNTIKKVELLVLNRDVKLGQSVEHKDFSKKTFEVKENNDFIPYDNDISDLNGAIATKDIESNSKLKYSMFAKKGSKEYSKLRLRPKNNLLAFAFTLNKREKMLLDNIGANQKVDIYFKYEIKNKQNDNGGLSPKKDGDNVNSVTLMPLFQARRVLYFEPKVNEVKEVNDRGKFVAKKVESEDESNVYIELSQNDIKKIYSIENLGTFLILPQSNGKTQKSFSTDTILPNVFIKQLKGGNNDNAN